MPDADRKAVYDHLASHYEDFGKVPPEWKPGTRSASPDRLELRGARVELRGADDPATGLRLEGYAALFNVPSQPLQTEEDDSRNGGYGMEFTEVIRPGAFTRALASSQDVRCLWNHEAESPLGRTASGTLTLREDGNGLYFSCNLPDTSLGRDVAELVRRGDVNQASFAFRAVQDRWSGSASTGYVRELLDCDLFDVSAVTYPAYAQTSVAIRSVRVPTTLTNPRSTTHALARARLRAHTLGGRNG